MENLMNNKIGLITAAGSGIGRASALTFAKYGAKVVVSDVSEEAGQETVRLIKEKGGEASFVPCNVADEEQVKALVDKTVELYGRLDFAHNNAGISGATTPITEVAKADWEKTYAVNVEGMFFSLKYEMLAMEKTGGGAIVNTASSSGAIGVHGLSAYSSSKWAVNGLTKTAALEGGKKGIRVNSILPGMTRTPAIDKWMAEVPEQAAAVEASIPIGRIGEPEDQAKAALFLCSDLASYVTGVNLPVEGGQLSE
ncbi:SDR family NAD(P)-dependent oxidoreductase [Listeria kieliensis]